METSLSHAFKVLLSASKIYSILFIINSLLHVNRLNEVSGVTSKMGTKWYNFTKIVKKDVSLSYTVQPT